jgi:hypothetical protein
MHAHTPWPERMPKSLRGCTLLEISKSAPSETKLRLLTVMKDAQSTMQALASMPEMSSSMAFRASSCAHTCFPQATHEVFPVDLEGSGAVSAVQEDPKGLTEMLDSDSDLNILPTPQGYIPRSRSPFTALIAAENSVATDMLATQDISSSPQGATSRAEPMKRLASSTSRKVPRRSKRLQLLGGQKHTSGELQDIVKDPTVQHLDSAVGCGVGEEPVATSKRCSSSSGSESLQRTPSSVGNGARGPLVSEEGSGHEGQGQKEVTSDKAGKQVAGRKEEVQLLKVAALKRCCTPDSEEGMRGLKLKRRLRRSTAGCHKGSRRSIIHSQQSNVVSVATENVVDRSDGLVRRSRKVTVPVQDSRQAFHFFAEQDDSF